MSNKNHLSSLSIQNYRGLDGLEVSQLGQVNLIIGKNNVGKSSLLETIFLWGTQGHPSIIAKILELRQESMVTVDNLLESDRFIGKSSVWNINYLFANRPDIGNNMKPIVIMPVADKSRMLKISVHNDRKNGSSDKIQMVQPQKLYVDVEYSINKSRITLGEHIPASISHSGLLENKVQFVSSRTADSVFLSTSKLWDAAEMRGKTEYVVKMMQKMDETIKRIFFVSSLKGKRIPFCELRHTERPVPLRSIGDGMNHLFELALALVASSEGLCLIDEIENGLHWSVQDAIWEILFQLAKELNIQVFITTHSFDTLKTFQKVAIRQEKENFAGIVQMRKKEGKTIAQPIFGEDIQNILQYDVEVR